jgi:hypothetical protein
MQMMVESATDVPQPSSAAKDRKRREKLAARACVLCNQAHTACDDERPCKRCVSKNIAHLCRDAEPRKRGRPAKLPEQYDLDLQQAQRRNTQQHSALQLFSSPIFSLPANGYSYPQIELTNNTTIDLDYDSSLLTDIPMSSFDSSSLMIDMPSPSTMMPQMVNSPPIQLPEAYNNHSPTQSLPLMPMASISVSVDRTVVSSSVSSPDTQVAVIDPKPICPPGFGFLSTNCSIQKYPKNSVSLSSALLCLFLVL